MEIRIISKSCVKVRLTQEEADELGIDFESHDSSKAKDFVGYILTVMGGAAFTQSPYDRITVEAFEQPDGDIILYVSSSPYTDSVATEKAEAVFYFRTADEIIDFLLDNKNSYTDLIDNAELYVYNGGYCLVMGYKDGALNADDKILIAKIKEYGRLICDTPFDSLI
ncbi:MAG: hypothetical protein IJU04_00975 [Ruminococcus sp.]|nr:hypothetical protein [Ruminococcus sp.]